MGANFGDPRQWVFFNGTFAEARRAAVAEARKRGVTTVEVLHEACKVETSKMTMLQMQDVGRLMSLLGWDRSRLPAGIDV
jgi:hypothetical protein